MRRSGVVDYLSWSQRLKLEDIPLLVKHCRTAGPLTQSALTERELQLLHNMLGRLQKLAEVASEVPPPAAPRPRLPAAMPVCPQPVDRNRWSACAARQSLVPVTQSQAPGCQLPSQTCCCSPRETTAILLSSPEQ